MPARDRPHTRHMAEICFGSEAVWRLDHDLCPTCGSADKAFRNELSRAEHEISGLCQECQDKTFGIGVGDMDR